MKVYLDPISTTSRPILLFLAESGTPAEIVKVDLFQGEHKKPEYAKINPNQCVPTLDDDGFLLTESSAILKYLAEKARSPLYPQDLKARARVNEVMDWFNTHFYRDLGYGVVYPQTVPGAGFANATTQSDVVSRAKEQTEARFKILNDHFLAKNKFLCGPEPTIADYLGAAYVSITDWVDLDISRYPNVARWMKDMKARPSWEKVNGPWNGLVTYIRSQRSKPN